METNDPPLSAIERSRNSVEQALRESALPDADIGVLLQGEVMVLKGCVYSDTDIEKALRIATEAAPGAHIRSELIVKPVRAKDIVYEAGVESFPASDPPSWMSH